MQGIAGPYWYAGAAVVQILCFGIIAVYIKVSNTLLFTRHKYIYYTLYILYLFFWAARYYTWLLIKLTPKGVVFSFLFLYLF